MKSAEYKYYENPLLWETDRYIENKEEIKRYRTCTQLISDDVTSLLDVGAGNGAFLNYLEREKSEVKLFGLERSEAAIQASIAKTRILKGTLENLPFNDDGFDMISALEVVEHLPFGVYEKGIKEIERVAKRYILLSVPYQELRINTLCPYCGCSFNQNYHMRSFDEKKLENLFDSFAPIRYLKVGQSKRYLFSSQVHSLYNWLFDGFPATSICPQCGYSKEGRNIEDEGKNSGESWKRNFISLFKGLLPYVMLSRWIIVLYQRNGYQ